MCLDSRYSMIRGQGGMLGAMSDQMTDSADVGRLIGEISRLRGEVAHLQQKVEQLDQLAHRDALINLPNRRGFMRELERLVDRAQRYGHHAAMLFVDLDGLKMINDTFGHRAGDEALIQVADMLTKGVRRSDVVARIGGDEFAVLLENATEESAHETAARLEDLICGCEFTHDGDALPLSVAIGVGMIDGDDEPHAVMQRADEEMYRRKAAA
jgi:diguanylate cyclase (GGDEF)-like protein